MSSADAVTAVKYIFGIRFVYRGIFSTKSSGEGLFCVLNFFVNQVIKEILGGYQ